MRTIRFTVILVMLGCVFFSSACSPFVENNTIEEIAPVIFWYIQGGDEKRLQMSTLVPPLIAEKKRLLTLQVDLIKQGGKEFNLIYYRELKSGQLRMVLINEEFARKGILPIKTTLLTDPDITQRLYLVVVQGDFANYIERQLTSQPNLDYFLYRMLKHYEEYNQGEMTIVDMHDFMEKYHAPLSSPILPLFKVSGDNFTYEGTALFKEDKLRTTITKMEDQIFQLIDHDHFLKLLPLPSLSVSIGHVRSNVDITLDPDYNNLTIEVDLDGRVEEYWGEKNLFNTHELAALQAKVEAYMEEHTINLLKKIQEKEVDPLQIGTLTLHPFRKELSEQEWEKFWKNMQFTVDYNLYLQPLTNTTVTK